MPIWSSGTASALLVVSCEFSGSAKAVATDNKVGGGAGTPRPHDLRLHRSGHLTDYSSSLKNRKSPPSASLWHSMQPFGLPDSVTAAPVGKIF